MISGVVLALAFSLVDVATRPVPLRTGIGSAHDAVKTASAEAQKFYDQGFAYLHSYVWLEAARSFNQALRIDPNLAMARYYPPRTHPQVTDQAYLANWNNKQARGTRAADDNFGYGSIYRSQ